MCGKDAPCLRPKPLKRGIQAAGAENEWPVGGWTSVCLCRDDFRLAFGGRAGKVDMAKGIRAGRSMSPGRWEANRRKISGTLAAGTHRTDMHLGRPVGN